MNEKRETLLLQMYDQMFNDINRHIMVVWQSISVLVGAFAVLALVEKAVIPLDIASALILLIAGWLFAHLCDASYWYNRNLAIIANIERQFLEPADLRRIHYYWGSHRPHNRMILHLRIQYFLGIGIVAIVLYYHFVTRVVPGIDAPYSNFDLARAIPYLVLVAIVLYLLYLHRNRNQSYAEFLANSPGDEVNTGEIAYGVGHGFRKKDAPLSGPSQPNGSDSADPAEPN